MNKLILCAIAAAALSSGGVAFAQAGSVGDTQQELYPQPYGNSGWTPDQAYGGHQNIRPHDDRHGFVAPPPPVTRADRRIRRDRDDDRIRNRDDRDIDGDRIRNRDDRDRDGDGVANRRDRYPDDAGRR